VNGPGEHPNERLIRELYRLLAEGDLSGYFELLTDDVVFHVGGDSLVAGDHAGKEAVLGLGVRILEETAGTFRTVLLGVLANDTFVVTLHRWTAERRGLQIAMDNFNVYRVEDGRVAERWELIERHHEHDEFWRA
jgi:ketosteroid isomerase-like protein